MAFSLVKSTINYSIEARRQLANSDDNPYKNYAVPGFDLADFVLDLDKFLRHKLPADLKDALSKVSLRFPDELPINLLFYFRLGNNFPELESEDDRRFVYHPSLFPDVPCDVEAAYESLIRELGKNVFLPPDQNKPEIILSKLVPYFAILGLLDYGFDKNLSAQSRRAQAMFQVEHSHRKRNPKYHLNMPAPYYALVSTARETVYICLDSCTFMFDLEQQRWLLRIYAQARELFPSYKFNILSYHGLRYVPSASQQPLDDAKLASEWTWYKQTDSIELTRYPSILIGQDRVLSCNSKGSKLGLNGTIGAGLELFLRLHNIIISAICSSNLEISKID